MADILDDGEIEIPCDICSRVTKKPIDWVKDHPEFRCACGTVIRLDTLDFLRKIAEAENALANFARKLE